MQRRLGHYEIRGKLGEGGMGVDHRAIDRRRGELDRPAEERSASPAKGDSGTAWTRLKDWLRS